jgi:hypothetical protein
MKLRWWISVDGIKTLQYWDGSYWRDVEVELEVTKEYEEQGKLRNKIRELENDYRALIEARK